MTDYIFESSKLFNKSFNKLKTTKSKTQYHEKADGDIFGDTETDSDIYPEKIYYYIRENGRMVKKLFIPSVPIDLMAIQCK